jgi:hypothetical protein
MHQDLGYPEHQVHRERVCELLWPDRDARAGRNNLHGALHAARRALAAAGAQGRDVLPLRDELVAIVGASVDVDRFEAARGNGAREPRSRRLPRRARPLWRRAPARGRVRGLDRASAAGASRAAPRLAGGAGRARARARGVRRRDRSPPASAGRGRAARAGNAADDEGTCRRRATAGRARRLSATPQGPALDSGGGPGPRDAPPVPGAARGLDRGTQRSRQPRHPAGGGSGWPSTQPPACHLELHRARASARGARTPAAKDALVDADRRGRRRQDAARRGRRLAAD